MRTPSIATSFVLALAASGCSKESVPAGTPNATTTNVTTSTSSTVVGEYANGTDGAQTVTINGLHIETAPDLPENKATTTQVVSGDNQTVIVLRGWQVVVQDGKLLVAGHAFGTVPAEATIRLAADGVHVNGELRGTLP